MARSRETKIELTAYDDLFQTDESREEAKLSKIRDIPISEIDEFPDHPFKVLMDEDMEQLVESIKRNGVMTPATVRIKEDGRYELISGHRRKKACELAGLETLKCEVKELTRDEAIIVMVESNLQRSVILPSEKAFAYKMRLEAMKRQAGRPPKENASPLATNLSKGRSDEELGELVGESKDQIRRYIRLTELVPEILQMVDERQIAFRPAVEISYLTEEQQYTLLEAMEYNDATPSLAQAIKMKKFTEIFNVLDEGTFPKTENEAMISINAKDTLKLKIGEQIVITTPNGTEFSYIISGFMKNSANLMREDVYGVFLTTDGFRTIYSNETDVNPSEYTMFFVLFDNKGNIPKEIAEIKEQYGLSDKQVTENITLLGLMGQSDDSFMAQVYTVAIILFFLVLMAGVLMIASSMNTNVAQRTEFFGMVRCIGATPKQVMQLVRKEVMNWCRFAIPLGVIGGMVLVWVLCFILRQLSPQYFGGMPAFSISYPSIIAGIVVGLLTVLLAARSPAKKASKVSPLAAVSGNANDLQPVKKAANTKFFKIDTSLGIHHAKASKKNFILMISSFSISIILFLAFSVTIDFMNHTLTPLQPWTADISVISPEDTCSVKAEFIEELQQNLAVKNVYGRMFAYNVPVIVNGEEKVVDLISYEDMQFDWAKDYVLSGSLEKAQSESNTGLIVFEPQNDIEVGNVILSLCDCDEHKRVQRYATTCQKAASD